MENWSDQSTWTWTPFNYESGLLTAPSSKVSTCDGGCSDATHTCVWITHVAVQHSAFGQSPFCMCTTDWLKIKPAQSRQPSKTVQTTHSVSKLGAGEVKGSGKRCLNLLLGSKSKWVYIKNVSVSYVALYCFQLKVGFGWFMSYPVPVMSSRLNLQTSSSHGSSGGSGWRWILVCQGSVPNGSGATDSAATVLWPRRVKQTLLFR